MNNISIGVDPYIRLPQGTIGTLCNSYEKPDPIPPKGQLIIVCVDSGVRGRYVTLRRTGGFRMDALSICEMKVYAVDQKDVNHNISIHSDNYNFTEDGHSNHHNYNNIDNFYEENNSSQTRHFNNNNNRLFNISYKSVFIKLPALVFL
ncbi:hypothetical protein HELRODRAFT_178928 [Helobdella robusta]|uniref:Uncharacterized protein n=1 Tax=Helobdella robusta TaxID=6412 RepID=T1FDW9_HELRO|nr:hypothetical protein HELRODRAFT_178928 [Helobdella robusta]ESN95748.1 hypothetical protein HELRODRAFT_178928 [Helobdella robusta]